MNTTARATELQVQPGTRLYYVLLSLQGKYSASQFDRPVSRSECEVLFALPGKHTGKNLKARTINLNFLFNLTGGKTKLGSERLNIK